MALRNRVANDSVERFDTDACHCGRRGYDMGVVRRRPEEAEARKGASGKGGYMTLQTRLESLQERHASLEMRIADEDQRPRPDTDVLMRLKVEKLRVKEEIERLRSQSP